MQNEKQAVARNSMIASGLLATGKFVAGIFTGSIGLISEGIHSFYRFYRHQHHLAGGAHQR